jgi:hypothetical protein
MIGGIQRSLRHLFTVVLNPEHWGLDQPLPHANSVRWRRSLVEIPVLKNTLMRGDTALELRADYVFQYRAQFRFPANLKYDQLPFYDLYNILEYLNLLITTHPGLLSKTPAQIDAMIGWTHTKVDPCLYEDQGTEAQGELSVRVVNVNGFIPVVETEGSDWLVTMVWSIECSVTGDISAFKRYFREVLPGDQIGDQDLLLGGDPSGRPPYNVGINLYRAFIGEVL